MFDKKTIFVAILTVILVTLATSFGVLSLFVVPQAMSFLASVFFVSSFGSGAALIIRIYESL